MVHERVTSNDIARVVAKATGIPVQNLMKGVRKKSITRGSCFSDAPPPQEKEKLVHVRPVCPPHGAAIEWLEDGGNFEEARGWTRPRRRSHQRCCSDFPCGSLSP